MKSTTNHVTLDIHNQSSQCVVHMKRGDTARRIVFSLMEDGVPYQISSDCSAVFTAEKPDGAILYNGCTIEGRRIIYDVTPQTTAVIGKVECEIRLYGANDALITSPMFTLLVDDTVYDDSSVIESGTEVSKLTQLISDASNLISTVEEKLNNGEFNGKGLTIMGYYASVQELSSAIISPEIGDAYGVGNSAPYNIYIWDGTKWVDNGKITGSSTYTLPAATGSTLGGIKVGSNLSIDTNGVLSVTTAPDATEDDTRPITSAAVHTEIGNIDALLSII